MCFKKSLRGKGPRQTKVYSNFPLKPNQKESHYIHKKQKPAVKQNRR